MNGYLVALVALECVGLVWWAQQGPFALRGFAAGNMIAVAFFAPKLADYFGLGSNAGNVMYATTVAAQLVVLETSGRAVAVGTAKAIFQIYAFLLVLAWLLSAMPVVGDADQAISDAIGTVAAYALQAAPGSFVAFVVSQVVVFGLHYLLSGCSHFRAQPIFVRFAALAFVWQAIDSPLFFAITFRDRPIDWIVATIASEFVVKLAVGAVLFLPSLYSVRLIARRKFAGP